MPEISVIIPFYNSEKYLNECIDSVLRQTFEDFEVICVDDCSSDNSVEIIKEYSKKDNRVRLLQNKQNSGPGASRNLGVDNAKGKYIFFLDSDDFICIEILKILYDTLKETDSDTVISRTITFCDDEFNEDLQKKANVFGPHLLCREEPIKNFIVTPENYCEAYEKLSCIVWGRLYKKEFFTKNHLRFIEKVYNHEDIGFFFKYLACEPKFTIVDDVGIMYRIREDSLSYANVTKVGLSFKEDDLILCLQDAKNYINEYIPSPKKEKIFENIKKNLYWYGWGKIGNDCQ